MIDPRLQRRLDRVQDELQAIVRALVGPGQAGQIVFHVSPHGEVPTYEVRLQRRRRSRGEDPGGS